MNQVFLLKLVADLIKADKPTVEEIRCARVIVDNLIKHQDNPTSSGQTIIPNSELDADAEEAKRELTK